VSSTQFLINAASRHAVLSQRYSRGREAEFQLEVSRILADIEGRMAVSRDGASTVRMMALREELSTAFGDAYKVVADKLFSTLEEFGLSEARFAEQLLSKAISPKVANFSTAVSPDLVRSALSGDFLDVNLKSPMTIRSAIDKLGVNKTEEISRLIKDGIVTGKTPIEISSAISKTTDLTRSQAAALVRTSASASSSIAKQSVYEENMELLDGYRWVSTLDARTSVICMTLDGQLFSFNDKNPKPPRHWGCRSTTVPQVKKEFDKFSDVGGKRPSSGGDGRELVDSRTTYSGWLKKQSSAFQDEALGSVRGKLLRRGDLSLDSFIDPTGRTYSLQELEALNPLAFN